MKAKSFFSNGAASSFELIVHAIGANYRLLTLTSMNDQPSFFRFWILIGVAALASSVTMQAQVEGREMDEIGKHKDVGKILTAQFPPGSRHELVQVPMRDGVKLATSVFIPPGADRRPVVFARGYYGRLATTAYSRGAQDGGFVYVTQDARGVFDSGGEGAARGTEPVFELNDSADSLEWIAAQPWCNGRIVMTGASGNGVGPSAAYFTKSPHLAAAMPSISSANPYYYWGFDNGVRRGFYRWMKFIGVSTDVWPKPTLSSFDEGKMRAMMSAAAVNNPAILTLSTGWYDLGSEAVLDAFSAFAKDGRVFARIGPNAHTGSPQFPWPSPRVPRESVPMPKLLDVVAGKLPTAKSQLTYYLLGNFRDASSPGNRYKVTDVWPVPHTPVRWYLHADGGLATEKPAQAEGTMGFAYDPRDPAPTHGGNFTTGGEAGPHDQRPLKNRKDVVRFIGEPLAAPLEITGKLRAELYVSTDVPDTQFVVKVIDIHPDGYEMLIRESAIMGRSAEEFKGKPSPLEKGTVYQLKLDLWSTAIVLDKGHRLGVLVTSSSASSYEVHPNSFVPVMSYDKSPVAHQTIHASASHSSCIIVPVVTPAEQNP